MRNFILSIFSLFCLLSTVSFGQTYSTGLFNMIGGGGEFDAQIDINTSNNMVILTLIGPDSGWLGMGFDSFSHDNTDVVMFDGTDLQDRIFTGGFDEPNLDGSQDWTVTNNTANGGLRTVVATRARNTGDANDYVFSSTPGSLNIGRL